MLRSQSNVLSCERRPILQAAEYTPKRILQIWYSLGVGILRYHQNWLDTEESCRAFSQAEPFYLRFLHLLIYSNTISGHLVTSHHNPLQLASHRLTSNFILPHLIPLHLINPLKYYHLTPIIHLHRLTQSLSQVSLSHTCHHISPS